MSRDVIKVKTQQAQTTVNVNTISSLSSNIQYNV